MIVRRVWAYAYRDAWDVQLDVGERIVGVIREECDPDVVWFYIGREDT